MCQGAGAKKKSNIWRAADMCHGHYLGIFGHTFRGRFVVNFTLDLTIIATLLTDFQSHTMLRT